MGIHYSLHVIGITEGVQYSLVMGGDIIHRDTLFTVTPGFLRTATCGETCNSVVEH